MGLGHLDPDRYFPCANTHNPLESGYIKPEISWKTAVDATKKDVETIWKYLIKFHFEDFAD